MLKRAFMQFSGVMIALLAASAAALVLYVLRSIVTGNAQFSFMAWNLLLSLFALLASAGVWIASVLRKRLLLIVAFVVWLALLPNTFYMLTDFVHVQNSGDITIVYDIAVIGFFAMNGFVHGLLSVFIVHTILLKYATAYTAHVLIAATLLASSFAVDMGRYLRWNTWDLLLNPRALLFDISDTLLNPTSYQRSFLVTGVFFVVSGGLYLVLWQLSKVQWPKS